MVRWLDETVVRIPAGYYFLGNPMGHIRNGNRLFFSKRLTGKRRSSIDIVPGYYYPDTSYILVYK